MLAKARPKEPVSNPARNLVVLAALTLTGCASLTHFLPHENRYFTVYCLTKQQYEQLKQSQPRKIHDQLTGEADKDVRIIAGNLIRVRAHDDGVLEVLGGCVDPKS